MENLEKQLETVKADYMAAQSQSANKCQWQPCPYLADFGVIKTKLDQINEKLDSLGEDLRLVDGRLREVEQVQARMSGIAVQAQWDFKTIVMMAMFTISFVGVILTVIKDFVL